MFLRGRWRISRGRSIGLLPAFAFFAAIAARDGDRSTMHHRGTMTLTLLWTLQYMLCADAGTIPEKKRWGQTT